MSCDQQNSFCPFQQLCVPQFQKNHELSLTQDASLSVLIDESNQNILAIELNTKVTKAWGRVFMEKLRKYSEMREREKKNLAYVLAERMPPNIRGEVIKIVRYYEEHMQMQIDQIHALILQNKKLKHELQKKQDKEFEILSDDNKQNSLQVKQINSRKLKQNSKVSESKQLEQHLLQKNKQIAGLNKEITDLHGKVRKYKKRVYELEAKSPIKNAVDIIK